MDVKCVEDCLEWLREKFNSALEEKVLLKSGLVVIGLNQAGSSVCAEVFSILDSKFDSFLIRMANNKRIMFYILATSGSIDNAEEINVRTSFRDQIHTA